MEELVGDVAKGSVVRGAGVGAGRAEEEGG